MPLVDGVEISPDDAIAQDKCPECGVDLTQVHPRSHFNQHWQTPMTQSRLHDEAKRRIALTEAYLEAHPEIAVKE